MKRLATLVLAATVGLALLQWPAYEPVTADDRGSRLSVYAVEESPSRLHLAAQIAPGRYDAEYRISLLPTSARVSDDWQVFFYYDSNYPTICNRVPSILGVWDHLRAQAPAGSAVRSYALLDEMRLYDVLTKRPSEGAILVLTTTVLPKTVFSAEVDLLTPWMEAGGVVMWVGEALGAFTAEPSLTPPKWEDEQNLRWSGELRLLGGPLVASPSAESEAALRTDIAEALDLRYKKVYSAAQVQLLRSLGGVPLGYLSSDGGRSSISFVPVGVGGLLHFGGCIGSVFTDDGEDAIAWDMSQIIRSGLLTTLLSAPSDFYAQVEGKIQSATVRVTKDGPAQGVEFPIQSEGPYLVYAFSRSIHDVGVYRIRVDGNDAPLSDRSSPFPEQLRLELRADAADPHRLVWNYELSATNRSHGYTVAVVPLSTAPRPAQTVYFFQDDAYHELCNWAPSRGLNRALNLAIHGSPYVKRVQTVNAEELAAVLAGPPATLIVSGSVLPASLFGKYADALTPWIKKGGILVWIGDALGAYSSGPNADLPEWGAGDSLGWAAEQQLTGHRLVGHPSATHTVTNHSNVSAALQLRYPGVQTGARTDALADAGGVAIGKVGGTPERSSTAWVPVGDGGILHFGHCLAFTTERELAKDIATLVGSGIVQPFGGFWNLSESLEGVTHVKGHAPRYVDAKGIIATTIDPQRAAGLLVVVTSDTADSPLLAVRYLSTYDIFRVDHDAKGGDNRPRSGA